MKKVTLIIVFVVALTNNVKAQSTFIADKNNPQSILFAFKEIKYRFLGIDKIVDSLAHKGEYEVFIVNDKIMYTQEEYFKNYDGDSDDENYHYDEYAVKHTFTLYTSQNAICHSFVGVDRGGSETDPGNGDIYKLVNSADKSKLLSLGFGQYDGVVYGTISVSDFNPHTGSLSYEPEDEKIFAVKAKNFFKESTPDSIIQTLVTTDFQITHLNKEGVAECRLAGYYWMESDEVKKWLKGDVIHFDFVDGKFIRSEPYFEDDKNR